jgi:uncharacterized protein YcnI
MTMRIVARTSALLATAAVLVALAALPAAAHVTIDPAAVPRGSASVVLHFVVPNEEQSANTTQLTVEFPTDHPIALVRPLSASGWRVQETTTKLAKPVTTSSGTFTDVVSAIEWSGGSITPGQFGEFTVLAQGLPTTGNGLVFPAVQTYSDGTIVRWIELTSTATPDPEHPAPTVSFTGAATTVTTTPDPAALAPTAAATSGGSSSNGAAYLAIVLACFAAGVGLLALWFGRIGRDHTETAADDG